MELSATENRAFRKAGVLLAELVGMSKESEALANITFPLVKEGDVATMKKALAKFVELRSKMTDNQKHTHNDIANDVAHFKF